MNNIQKKKVELGFELVSKHFGSKLLVDHRAGFGGWVDGWMDEWV